LIVKKVAFFRATFSFLGTSRKIKGPILAPTTTKL
jgi:hypothetical protein